MSNSLWPPGFPVLHYLPEFAQTHVHGVGDVIQPSQLGGVVLKNLMPGLHCQPPKYRISEWDPSIGILKKLSRWFQCVIKVEGYYCKLSSILHSEKAMAPHSITLAWKIPWTEEPGGLQSMGLLRVGHDWETSVSLFTFMHWRRKWQPTPVFLPGESQGWGSLVGCCLWGHTESDMTEAT